MTRKILLVVFFSMQAISSYGCESCGCSFSGLGLGMLTGFNRTYAGLSYQSSGFASAEGHNPTIHDQMQLLELSFRYRINSRWQVQAVLPYRHNRRTEPGFTGLKQGISDVSMMGFYRFINQKQLGKSTILSLDGGAGFQAPTGQYEYDLVHRQGLPDNFSLGYGAWPHRWQAPAQSRVREPQRRFPRPDRRSRLRRFPALHPKSRARVP